MSTTAPQGSRAERYAREKRAAYTRQYRADHPNTTLQWRINSAVNLLTRNGWTLMPPERDTIAGGDQE